MDCKCGATNVQRAPGLGEPVVRGGALELGEPVVRGGALELGKRHGRSKSCKSRLSLPPGELVKSDIIIKDCYLAYDYVFLCC